MFRVYELSVFINLNTTQIVGLASFGTAAILAGLAAYQNGQSRGTWKVVSAMSALMFLEIWGGFRFDVSRRASFFLKSFGLYGDRRDLQAALLLSLMALVLLAVFSLVRKLNTNDRFAQAALVFGLGALTVFAIETISLHAIDAIFYFPINGVLFIGWVWSALASAMLFSAFGSILSKNKM